VVEQVSNGRRTVFLEDVLKTKPGLNLPCVRMNPVISIIPVNYGCLGSCAYCCVVFARGRLRSYGIQEVIKRMKRDIAGGVREFWLTSQDTACYGRDIGTNLAELLEAVCTVEGDFKIRVGMMTPNLVMDILEDLICTFKSEKIYKFAHLPVQSGDDQILKRMRRFYSVEEFKKIVNAFRASFPQITIATDVICGFPGENKEAFEKTLRLIGEVKPDIVNVSKFFARPKTAAARMQADLVSLTEIKRRSSEAAELARKIAFEKNQRWIGWEGEILVNEMGKVAGSWVGRNFAYKPVAVKGDSNLLGKNLCVRVVRAFSTHLEGEIIE
ncbi:MAG: tRNA (N(6)-L-threonylcarbamoyladenosine(37)-C(2))-methylthiotransferase, partial [Candidatus Bathyarchaeia archaeon]